jgi:hypothetical protein
MLIPILSRIALAKDAVIVALALLANSAGSIEIPTSRSR